MHISQAQYNVMTQLALSLCFSIFASQLRAETQAQAPVQVIATSTQDFGRLFSKPNERNMLNLIRQNQKLKTISAQEVKQVEPTAEVAPELPDPITLQGYVKRNDGAANTLWINGRAVQENSSIGTVRIGKLNQNGFSKKGASTEGVDVKIPANGKQVRLKAGQMYAPEDNKVYELQVVEKAKRLSLERSGVINDNNE